MTYNSQKTRIYWLKSPIHDEITLVSDTHKFHRLPYSKFRDSSICVTRPICMRDFALSIILENVSCEVPWLIYMCDTTHLYARVCSVFVLEQVFCLGKIIQNTFFSNECAGLHTATHCSTVLCTATHYCILQHIPTHCNPSLHTAIHCDLHCDTFLYTATQQHSNTTTQQDSKDSKYPEGVFCLMLSRWNILPNLEFQNLCHTYGTPTYVYAWHDWSISDSFACRFWTRYRNV